MFVSNVTVEGILTAIWYTWLFKLILGCLTFTKGNTVIHDNAKQCSWLAKVSSDRAAITLVCVQCTLKWLNWFRVITLLTT